MQYFYHFSANSSQLLLPSSRLQNSHQSFEKKKSDHSCGHKIWENNIPKPQYYLSKYVEVLSHLGDDKTAATNRTVSQTEKFDLFWFANVSM